MRILQLTSHLNVGGITRYVLSLSQRLVARGHRVIIASDRGSVAAQVKAMGATHYPLRLNTSAEFSLKVLWGIRQLAGYVAQEPVDVIHAHTRVAQVVADRISRRLNVPYVTTWHGIYKPRLGRRWWPCTGEATIAISGPVRQHLLRDFHVPERRIRCIYNGIDVAHYALLPEAGALQTFRKRWQIPEKQPIIGGIGRLAAGEVKGFDLLLVAAYLVQSAVPGLQVLIVGDGPRRPFLEDVARRLGVRHRVHFVGATQDIRVPLALMDIFVFPSRWPEAFGLTLVEAMAAGKPVVATSMGAVPEIIQHGVSGWLVPTEDPLSLAEAIARLMGDRSAARRIGIQAQTRVREIFSLDRMTAEVESVYQEVVNQGQPGPKSRSSPKSEPENSIVEKL